MAVQRVAVDQHHGLPAAVILVVDLDVRTVLGPDGHVRHGFTCRPGLPVHSARAHGSRGISKLTAPGLSGGRCSQVADTARTGSAVRIETRRSYPPEGMTTMNAS